MNPAEPRTQRDFANQPATARRSRGLQLLLGLFAAGCFGSAWLLGEQGDAQASARLAQTVDVTPEPVAAAQAPAAEQLALAEPASAAGEPAQDEVPEAAAPSQEEREVIEGIDAQIKAAPVRRKLTLPAGLRLRSSGVLVVDQNSGEVLAEQNADVVQPIASLTKLMTAVVVLEAHQPLDEVLEITGDDIDREKHSYSRLRTGLKFTRHELLQLALMSSENRAASALGRNYPGGQMAFLKAMNAKARSLGMGSTHYVDANGLGDGNVSTAQDLAKLVAAAYKVPLVRELSTAVERTVRPGKRDMHFVSSNSLIRAKSSDWRIGLQKTGFTNEAGRCLVMQATVKNRPLIMVLLDSDGKFTRFADAQRVRAWLEDGGRTQKTASRSNNKRHGRRVAEAG